MSASELRAQVAALDAIEADLTTLEAAAREHEHKDADRFMHLGQGQAALESRFDYLENRLDIIHDQLIEGLRKLGAQIVKRDPNEVTPPRRGRNGR